MESPGRHTAERHAGRIPPERRLLSSMRLHPPAETQGPPFRGPISPEPLVRGVQGRPPRRFVFRLPAT